MKNFQATSSISYCKQTGRRHELIERMGGGGDGTKTSLDCRHLPPMPQQTGVYASSPENATKLMILCRSQTLRHGLEVRHSRCVVE